MEFDVEEPVVSAKRLNLQSTVCWSTGSTSLPGATSLTHCFCAPGTSGPSEGIYANKRRLPFSFCYAGTNRLQVLTRSCRRTLRGLPPRAVWCRWQQSMHRLRGGQIFCRCVLCTCPVAISLRGNKFSCFPATSEWDFPGVLSPSCAECEVGKYAAVRWGSGGQGSGCSAHVDCRKGLFCSDESVCARCDQCGNDAWPLIGNCDGGSFTNVPSCEASGATECDSCDTGKTTERMGSTSAFMCVCAPGYYGDAAGQICQACDPGKYSDSVMSEQCEACAAGTYASGTCTVQSGNVDYCTKKGDGTPAESCNDLVSRHGPQFPRLKDDCCLCKWRRKIRMLYLCSFGAEYGWLMAFAAATTTNFRRGASLKLSFKYPLPPFRPFSRLTTLRDAPGGKASTAATTCTFCQAGKFSVSPGESTCVQCTFAKNQTCSSSADCAYDGCVHPNNPLKALADQSVKCFANDEDVANDEGQNFQDLNGYQVVAGQCYALPEGDTDSYASCPSKDAITSPVGSSAMVSCEGYCDKGAEYVKATKTCQLCPVVFRLQLRVIPSAYKFVNMPITGPLRDSMTHFSESPLPAGWKVQRHSRTRCVHVV